MNLKAIKPTALCFAASFGVIATMMSAIHETPKACLLIQDKQLEVRRPLKPREKLAIRAKTYVPTFIFAAGTIACIFVADSMHKRQQAAMAQAYLLLSQAFQEYKAAVETATDEIAMGHILEHKERPTYTNPDKQAFYIEFYNKIFESTMLEVRDAEYYLNKELITKGYVSVNQFLQLLGLDQVDSGDILGWDYTVPWVDFDHGVVDVDDMDCFVITPRQRPWIDTREYPFDE